MTGETAKGRSMSVRRIFFPGNWNLVMAQEADNPKRRLQGTAIAAVSKVRRMAASATGSRIESTYTPHPLLNASVKTAASGIKRKSPKNISVIPIRRVWTQIGSDKDRGWPPVFLVK